MIKQMDKKGGETYGIIAVFNSGSNKGLTKKPATPFLMELGQDSSTSILYSNCTINTKQ